MSSLDWVRDQSCAVLDMIKAVLPGMRQRRAGHIVNLSSIGGLVTFPGIGYYHMAKFALEALSETLSKEVGPLGIGVTAVAPGAFRTDFRGGSMQLSKVQIADYAPTAGHARQSALAGHGQQRGDPVRACQAILLALQAEKPPLHLFLGPDTIELVHRKMDELQQELQAWDSLTRSTDVDG